MSILERFKAIRKHTEALCKPLQIEDYVVQPIVDVSPPKWHLGHTTWFFEAFLLKPYSKGYSEFDPDYNFVFNSYYESIGARVIRTDRGNLSRPTVEDIYKYRAHVDEAMEGFMRHLDPGNKEVADILHLGLNHEQQHQELLLSDIKYILGNNPLFPCYSDGVDEYAAKVNDGPFIRIENGVYEIGHNGKDFCFDNELNKHKVFLHDYKISQALVTNAEYKEFIEAGAYQDFRFWHSEGWEWVKANGIKAPMYWHDVGGEWQYYSLKGLKPISPYQPVCHINYFEAFAYANWRGMRLPTEAEWEVAAPLFNWGDRWEWTASAYSPYPGYKHAEGAIGEYNGKFMVNQKVLRGASIATPKGHSRVSYRNFFHTHLRWQFTGIRLAQ